MKKVQRCSYWEEQRKEEFKETIWVIILVFILIGVGLAWLCNSVVVFATSALTCLCIGAYAWKRYENG